MKLYIPLPFLYVQADAEIRKEKDFDELEIYIVLMLYKTHALKELNPSIKLIVAIKQFMNLNSKFFEFIKTIIINLQKNNVIEITNQELDENIMIGNLKLNDKVISNIDSDIFKGFSSEFKKPQYFVYKNLITLDSWKNVKDHPIKDLNTDIVDLSFNADDELKSYENEIKNSVVDHSNELNSDYVVTGIKLLNEKIVYINVDLNFKLSENKLLVDDIKSKNILDSIYREFDKFKYFNFYIENQLKLSNKMFDDYDFNNFVNNGIEFISTDNELKIIEQNYNVLKSLFKNGFNFVSYEDNLYTMSKINKNLFITFDDNKINVDSEYIVLNELTDNDFKKIDELILNQLRWDILVQTFNEIPNQLIEIIKAKALYLLKNETYYDESLYNYQQISDFLSKLDLTNDELNGVLFRKEMINNKMNDFTKKIFDYDSKTNKKFIRDFINVSMFDTNIEEYIVKIYSIDYDTNKKYFKHSLNEDSINKLREFIESIDTNKIKNDIEYFDDVSDKFKELKRNIKYVEPKFISSFEEKMTVINNNFENRFADEKDKVIGLSTKIANKMNDMYLNYYDVDNKNGVKDMLKQMYKDEYIKEEEFDQLTDFNKYRNDLVHNGSLSKVINKYNIYEYNKKTNDILDKTTKLIEHINKRNKK